MDNQILWLVISLWFLTILVAYKIYKIKKTSSESMGKAFIDIHQQLSFQEEVLEIHQKLIKAIGYAFHNVDNQTPEKKDLEEVRAFMTLLYNSSDLSHVIDTLHGQLFYSINSFDRVVLKELLDEALKNNGKPKGMAVALYILENEAEYIGASLTEYMDKEDFFVESMDDWQQRKAKYVG